MFFQQFYLRSLGRCWCCPTTSRYSHPRRRVAVGGNIGSRLSTTVGYERRTNAILAEVDTREGFKASCANACDWTTCPRYPLPLGWLAA
ncbi:MAG: hypothetical protein ACRDTH_07405 [Pseudonocardiaceae bacterium]